MRVISDRSLCCFLEDLRSSLKFYQENADPEMIFISIEGFYWYLQQLNVNIAANTQELIETIEPFIPMMMSERSLNQLLYVTDGYAPELAELEREYLNQSKLKFINTILAARSWDEWDRIRNICRTIRNYKSQLHNPVFM